MALPTPYFTRRGCLKTTFAASSGLAGGAIAESVAIEPQLLATTHLELGTPVSAAQRPLRVAQLSDLHLRGINRLEEDLLAATAAMQPDVLVLTGDAIDRRWGVAPLAEFLDALPATAHRLAIIGNWEYRAGLDGATFRRLLDRHGFRLLLNESITIAHEGQPLLITGLDDLVAGQPAAPQERLQSDPTIDHLLLAHCPATRDQLPTRTTPAPNLILSGHTHGGQIAPAGICLVTPPGSGNYVAGWYCTNGPPMYVSRGIGTSTIPIRLGSLPELVCLQWWLGSRSTLPPV
jgi:predicted MPP superfamily phosphohydrolase